MRIEIVGNYGALTVLHDVVECVTLVTHSTRPPITSSGLLSPDEAIKAFWAQQRPKG